MGRNRIYSDLEISDMDGNFSNAENLLRLGGGNFKFLGMETQGEETIGIVSFDEQTDFDNEFGIIKALTLFQNECAEKQQFKQSDGQIVINSFHDAKNPEDNRLVKSNSLKLENPIGLEKIVRDNELNEQPNDEITNPENSAFQPTMAMLSKVMST